jgi:DNA polymerase-3 subunit beta
MFTIEHQDGQIHFLAESADEYPVIDDIKIVQQFDDIEGERIGAAIKRCLWSAASDELRPAMCGVHMCTVQKYVALDIVASDGHSLVRNRLRKIGIDSESKISAILPMKAAKILADTLEEGNISLRFSEDKCQVETYRYRMTFRLVDAAYPKYNAVIPSDNCIEACADKAALLRAIKRTLPFAPDSSQLLSLHFEENDLTVSGDDIDFCEGARDIVDIDFSSLTPLTIGLKGSTLAKALGYIENSKVIIQMKDASTAVLLVPETEREENTQVTILMMPMLLND